MCQREELIGAPANCIFNPPKAVWNHGNAVYGIAREGVWNPPTRYGIIRKMYGISPVGVNDGILNPHLRV